VKIYRLRILENEVAVIARTLTAVAGSADASLVADHGSEDGPRETVQAPAGREPRIGPYKRAAKPFHPRMRGEPVADRRERCRDDGWCILDADASHPESPRAFVADSCCATAGCRPRR
jgi:hypothetical protein